VPDLKKPRHAIPCSADPEYDYPMPDNADFCCSRPQPKPKHYPHKKKSVEFVCGNAAGLSLPVSDGAGLVVDRVGGAIPGNALVAGTVNLDTSGMVQPTVKVDFSSVVNFLINLNEYVVGLLFSIDFRLSKICDGNKVHLGTWTYKKSVGIGGDLAEVQPQQSYGLGLQIDYRQPFNFSFCECDPCPSECCTYVVEIVNINSFGITSASLTNVSISALAVD
jgi:hypothetical protein